MTRVDKNPSWRLLLVCAVIFSTTVFAGDRNLEARKLIKDLSHMLNYTPYTLLNSTKEYELREYDEAIFPKASVFDVEKLYAYMRGANVDGRKLPPAIYPLLETDDGMVLYFPYNNYPQPTDQGVILKSYPKMKFYVRAGIRKHPLGDLKNAVGEGRYNLSILYLSRIRVYALNYSVITVYETGILAKE